MLGGSTTTVPDKVTAEETYLRVFLERTRKVYVPEPASNFCVQVVDVTVLFFADSLQTVP